MHDISDENISSERCEKLTNYLFKKMKNWKRSLRFIKRARSFDREEII